MLPDISRLLAVSAAVLLLGCASSSGSMESWQAEPAGALRPGDAVELSFWRETKLSRRYAVAEDGVVVLPFLGRVPVAGVPPDELRQSLLDHYAAQLRNQEGEITLLRRVRVIGEVNAPGLYHVSSVMTVSDAIALAGGPSERGAVLQVELRRGEQTALSEPSDQRLGPLHSGDTLVVPRDSWWARYSQVVVGALIGAIAIIGS